MVFRIATLMFLLVAFEAVVHAEEPNGGEQPGDFFRRAVEPIFRTHCFECHSHAAGEMNGGLTLDWRSGLTDGGGRGPAIVPGHPERSLLIQAVRHQHAELKMPEQKLATDQIAILEKWVREGAFDPRITNPESAAMAEKTDWWSLRPLVRPAVPQNGARHPIDAFIREQLLTKGLASVDGPRVSRAASRTLVRRLMVDLHGLHPEPDELTAVADDVTEIEWAKYVDQLLSSPHYGERLARHWFDTIHFADTHGFEHDELRPNAWRYRDYVIDRFNRDISWAQFVREQLAADVLFPDDVSSLAGLGFLGAGPYDRSAAGTAPKNFEYLDRDDLVTQVMTSFVSTTANCARCHTHKFDPVTQEDYFALQAVFAGIGKGEVTYDADPDVTAQRRRWKSLLTAAEKLDDSVLMSAEANVLVAEWESSADQEAAWQTLNPEDVFSVGGATLNLLADGSVLASGLRPDTDVYTFSSASLLGPGRSNVDAGSALPARLTAIRLDVLTDDSLPMRGPGRVDNGNLHLNEIAAELIVPGESEVRSLKFARATADFDQSGWTIAMAIDGNEQTAWGIHPKSGESHHAVFALEQATDVPAGATLRIILRQIHGRGHLIGRFRLSVTDSAAGTAVVLPSEVLDGFAVPHELRSTAQQRAVAAFALAARARDELSRLPEPLRVYAAAKVATNERGEIRFAQPREIRLLKRGEIMVPVGEPIVPGALSAIAVLPGRFSEINVANEGERRAALAEWIVSPQNPLTWRSIANRVWQHQFGRGLSETPGDFGRMGSLPTHPELLDWLACELRDGGGSLKGLHRLILTSETWRQSSAITAGDSAKALSIDPDNQFLWRMNRRRMDAETFRDSVLRVCGRLDFTMGGSGFQHFSTRPGTQVTPVVDYTNFDWDKPGAARRSIYRVVWRGMPDPLMDALDFPDAAMLAPKRGESSSALQALALWNNDFVLHHCGVLAQRAEAAEKQVSEQIEFLYRHVLLREPTVHEQSMMSDYAAQFGLAAVSRVLVNSNEFLFVD